ncbi:MAG: dipeptidase [Firmicutes bacterium]|nr:dipeptidase [Bacillota bacterium]MBR7147730.1 dipeptidase [Bacillota bacterium]
MGHIVDLHCDTIMECMLKNQGLAGRPGHINLEKLAKAGSMAQCFALFTISNDMQDECNYHGEVYDIYNKMYETFAREMELNKDVIRQARSAEEILKNNAEGKLSAILTIEDCIFVEGKMERIEEMAKRGVKMASLTWNYENSIGYPNNKNAELHKLGLKPFGIEAVEAMNDLGIIVDVAHLSEGGFWDVMKYSKKPICASHSCARALCDHPRNLTDEQLAAMGNSGSVVGVNFYSAFLEKDNLTYSSDEAILKHMVYIANKAGIETLALGSDFDGIDCDLEMKDYSGFPVLLEKMQKHFTDDQIDLITHKNFLRIL